MTTNIEPITHLSGPELAQRWGLSAAHLANLRSEGKGCAFLKLGSAVRYRLSDVLDYEAGRVVLAVA